MEETSEQKQLFAIIVESWVLLITLSQMAVSSRIDPSPLPPQINNTCSVSTFAYLCSCTQLLAGAMLRAMWRQPMNLSYKLQALC